MFGKVHYPVSIAPEELDEYLSKGWFRMGQTIFTSAFLYFKNVMYNAIWLRIDLQNYREDSSFKRLKKQNARFNVVFRPLELNEEKEILYQKYKSSMKFEPSANLKELLYGSEESEIYATTEICLYDHNRLIGVGFFDPGKNAVAGICSFYDPEYKKYSLGKYLIYLKVEYAANSGFRYFYPGYFAPGYPLFDYKLEIGKPHVEYFHLTSQQWQEVARYKDEESPLVLMRRRLEEVRTRLEELSISSDIFNYEFFNANLVPDFYSIELFDYPLFLTFMETNEQSVPPVLVFDTMYGNFKLLQCKSIYTLENSFTPEGNYCQHLMKEEQLLFESELVTEIVERIGFLKFMFSTIKKSE